jgi:uncharacterized membrane protein YbhN (UPF0104 family)
MNQNGLSESTRAASAQWLLRTGLPGVITLVAVAILAYLLFQSRTHIRENYSAAPVSVLALAGMTLLILALRGLANLVLFRRLGLHTSYRNWFGLVAATAFSNYFPLSAGFFAKGFFLKRVHSLPYKTYLAGQISLFLIFTATSGLLGFIALVLAPGRGGPWFLAAAFVAMTLTGLVLLLSSRWLATFQRLSSSADQENTAGWRRGWHLVVLCQGAIVLLLSAKLYLCFRMGPEQVPFIACVIFGAASIATRLVAVAPGAIGIRELLIGGLAYLTGFEPRDAVIASTIDRVVELSVVLVLGGGWFWVLGRKTASTYGR